MSGNAKRLSIWVAVAVFGLGLLDSAGALGATFLPTNGDYATGSNWTPSGVPGDGNNEHAHIWQSRTANYSSATSFTTTGRFIAGLGSGTGTLNITGSAGTLTFGGDDFSLANYVGVDGGTGFLNVQAGTLTTTTGALRVGSNAATPTGTVTIGQNGTINVGTGTNTPRLYIGARNVASTGTVNVEGGTLNVKGRVYMNESGGTGTLNVRGDSTVTIGDALYLEGSPVGSGLTYPTGVGTIGVDIYGGQFNTISVANSVNLNPSGASVLDVTLSGIEPPVATSWDIISYGSFDTNEQFSAGKSFTNSQGYGFALDYGTGTNDAMTLKLVSTPKSLLFDVGPTGVVSPGDPLTETTHNGLVWNNVSEIIGSGTFGGVEHADGTAAPGVTVTAGASGRGGSSTMNAAWGDAQGVPSEVMGTWYYNQISITIDGLAPGFPCDVELFNAFNLSGTNLSDMQVNGLFADGTTASTPENGDGWSRYNNGWVPRMGLFFDDVFPNAQGQLVITFTGSNPTLQAIRVTQVVPEPATVLLLALGGLGLTGYGWRRKCRARRA